MLLDSGESIEALSEYLEHTCAGFTLRTYTQLMPSSEARTCRAIDAVLTGTPVPLVTDRSFDGHASL